MIESRHYVRLWSFLRQLFLVITVVGGLIVALTPFVRNMSEMYQSTATLVGMIMLGAGFLLYIVSVEQSKD